MDDAVYAAQKARVEGIVARWAPLLDGGWDVKYVYDRMGERFEGDARQGALAKCTPQWKYQTVAITFNMPLVEKEDDAYLEYSVVHEFVHLYLDEVTDCKGGRASMLEHEEHATTLLARAMVRVRETASHA